MVRRIRCDITTLFPDHVDENGVLYNWLGDEIRGQRFEKASTYCGIAGQDIVGHYHEQRWEIYFCVYGKSKMALYDRVAKDSAVFEFVRGIWVVIPPGIVHELKFETDTIFEIASTTVRFKHLDTTVKHSLSHLFQN